MYQDFCFGDKQDLEGLADHISPCRFAVTYTANTMISSVYLNTADSHQKQITSSWATMWIGVSSLSRLFVCSSRTRLSTQKTSSFSAVTMSVHLSTASTDSTMSAKGATISSYGRRSPIASIACQSLQSLTRRSSQCMEG